MGRKNPEGHNREASGDKLDFAELFDLEEVQRMQDLFTESTGVSSVIVSPEGKQLTRQGNFCALCQDLIHQQTSFEDCFRSIREPKIVDSRPLIHICPKSRMYSASVGIVVGGNHLANWYIGQVRPPEVKSEDLEKSALALGIGIEQFSHAYFKAPVMSREQMEKIGEMLFFMISQLSQNSLMRLNLEQHEDNFDQKDAFQANTDSNFYDIFQNVKEGVAYTNLTGKVLAINNSLQKMLGLPEDQIVGKNFIKIARELLTDDYLTRALPFLKGLLQGRDFKNFVFEYKDQVLEISARVNLRTRRMIGVVRDITEQVFTEKVLRQSEERFRKAFYTSPDAICINRLRDGIFVSINKGFSQLTGYEEEQVIGRSSSLVSIWINEETRAAFTSRLLEKGYVENFENPFKLKNGEVREGLISASVIELDNEPHVISIIRDMHERIQIMKELQAAKEKAEESDRLKSAFLANMSHEIRTPMNGILGFADLLKNQELTGEKQQKYIEIIEKSGIRMLNIINDLIDISKIEAGQMDLHLQEFNAVEIVEDLIGFFRPEAEKKELGVRFLRGYSSGSVVMEADKEKLFAILTNLIKNGIKYSKEGYVGIGIEVNEPYVRFTVEDTGIGIEEGKLDHIFDRFIQADPLNEASQQGAGLGLAITKAYVDMMGGSISVSSMPGSGTVFTFDIPGYIPQIKEDKKQLPENKDMKALARTDLSILIVEDDMVSFDYLSILLEGVKKIHHAGTGQAAVRLCRDHPEIDVVLMDIGLPGMDGYDTTRQIRQFNKRVIIIAQTAYGMDGDKDKALAAGCDNYISKPIRKEEFYSIINSLIS